MARIVQIELRDFKNIQYGKIDFAKSKPGLDNVSGADIVGIYGQNGSGKTSVIEALSLLKSLFIGASYDSAMVLDFFYPGKDTFSLAVTFLLNTKLADEFTALQLVSYEVSLSRRAEVVWISYERLTCKEFVSDTKKFAPQKTLFEFSQDSPDSASILCPKGDWGHLLKVDQQLKMSTFVSFGVQQKEHTSLLFSEALLKRFLSLASCNFDLYKLEETSRRPNTNYDVLERQSAPFKSAKKKTLDPLILIICDLNYYFRYRVNVFSTLVNATCSLNILSMDIPDKQSFMKKGHLSVNLFEPALLPEDVYDDVHLALERVSRLMGALVPGFSIVMRELGSQLLDDGDTLAERVEFMSSREGVEIPLRCESEGVRKLISLSLCLMEVHSYRDSFLAIDELDSGVFEYLLGEILSVIDSFGKGQLLFTAHNLRVLELLPTSDIVFTTSDPANRFIRFKGLKPSNNLRDQYLRSVSLGGGDAELYVPTDKFSIDDALCLDGEG